MKTNVTTYSNDFKAFRIKAAELQRGFSANLKLIKAAAKNAAGRRVLLHDNVKLDEITPAYIKEYLPEICNTAGVICQLRKVTGADYTDESGAVASITEHARTYMLPAADFVTKKVTKKADDGTVTESWGVYYKNPRTLWNVETFYRMCKAAAKNANK